MTLRFNPPPNWPAPPEGFVPPAGWQPDPAWGPAPEGWQLWIDDAAPAAASGASAAAPQADDSAWAPTQAVVTGSSAAVADPTGAPVSAPSGDYAASPGPMMSGPSGMSAPLGASAPVAPSGPSAGPYAAQGGLPQGLGMYQGPSAQAPWQPVDVGAPGVPAGSGSKPITKQWWFWTIIGVVVVALVVVGVVIAVNAGDHPSPSGGSTQSQGTDDGGDSGGQGRSLSDPVSMKGKTLTIKGGSATGLVSDPNTSMDIQIGDINWDAQSEIQAAASYVEDPPADMVYIRIPVTVTYHGKDQMSSSYLELNVVSKDGTSAQEADGAIATGNEFRYMPMPYDGGTVTGYYSFLIKKDDVQNCVIAIKPFYDSQNVWYVKAE